MKDSCLYGTFPWMSHSRVQILMVVSSVQFTFVYWRICWTHFKLYSIQTDSSLWTRCALCSTSKKHL